MATKLTDYIATNHKTHLIFDFDATLVLMNIPWEQWADAVREAIFSLDADLWHTYKNQNSVTMQNAVVDKYGDEGLAVLLRHCPPFELQYSDKFDKNNPLLQEIETFRSTYHLYIWSSNSSQLVSTVLAEIGMGDWFEKVIARGELRFLKPSPEGFELIHDVRIPKKRYLMIGDSSHDRAAAEAAGIDFYLTDFFHQGR